jgi:phage shock protein C
MAFFCSGCGKTLPADARFCSACGKPVPEGGFSSGVARSPLVRPLAGRKIAGVCQGLANYYGWDVNITRVIAVLITVATIPLGLIAYGVFWVVVPQEQPATEPQATVAITNLNPTS